MNKSDRAEDKQLGQELLAFSSRQEEPFWLLCRRDHRGKG